MKVAVSGATGLIGSALAQRLTREGHEVVPLVRGKLRARAGAGGPSGSLDADGTAWELDFSKLEPEAKEKLGEELKTLLTPEDATHVVTLSPSGRFFVDRYSKPDAPPVAVLRDNAGKLVRTLEQADISRLTANGWNVWRIPTIYGWNQITLRRYDDYIRAFTRSVFPPMKSKA